MRQQEWCHCCYGRRNTGLSIRIRRQHSDRDEKFRLAEAIARTAENGATVPQQVRRIANPGIMKVLIQRKLRTVSPPRI
jgi:hypothetical protein